MTKAPIDALADTMAEVKLETFRESLADVKARTLRENRHYAIWRPNQWSKRQQTLLQRIEAETLWNTQVELEH